MTDPKDEPLPDASAAEEGEEQGAEEEDDGDDEGDETVPAPAPRPSPPRPTFNPMTGIYLMLGVLGAWMLFDTSARNQFAGLLGTSPTKPGPLYALIGFDSNYLLLTMALAGAVEMLITAVAYNYTTDWVKAARVQSWSSAFRKVQMAAVRSGKKDRLDALKTHQQRLARLSSEVSIAQFKGMAITYFLLILIYAWVGLVIGQATLAQQTIVLGGASIDLMHDVVPHFIPWWFLIFSLYTIPFSMVFRRVLKHLWLVRYTREHPRTPAPPLPGAPGGPA